MASRPQLVPEDQPWLLVSASSSSYLGDLDGWHSPACRRFKSKKEAFDWILEERLKGDTEPYELYGPDSRHEHVVSNKVVWERSNA